MIENVWQIDEVTCLQVELMEKHPENSSNAKFPKTFPFFDDSLKPSKNVVLFSSKFIYFSGRGREHMCQWGRG